MTKCEPKLKTYEQPEPPPPLPDECSKCVCPPPEEQKEVCPRPKCPFDPRYQQQNQTRHCYTSFVDYQRCARLLGDYPGCKIFLVCYLDLCPKSWIDKWYEQMENGTFPRCIYPRSPIVYPTDDTCIKIEKEPSPPPKPPC